MLIFLIITIAMMISSTVFVYAINKKIYDLMIVGILVLVLFVIWIGMFSVICIENSSSRIENTKARLTVEYEELEAAMQEENPNKWVIDACKKYNEEVIKGQEGLDSIWDNWFFCPAYKECKLIEINRGKQ